MTMHWFDPWQHEVNATMLLVVVAFVYCYYFLCSIPTLYRILQIIIRTTNPFWRPFDPVVCVLDHICRDLFNIVIM